MTAMENNLPQPPAIDIAIQDPSWNEVPDIETLVRTAVETSLKMAMIPDELAGKDMEISILLANDDLSHILNREYRGKDNPTNILTFANIDSDDKPEQEETITLGDIILSFETIQKEAREEDKFLRDHVLHLAVHGTLHLLGYNHDEEDDATIMETLEIRILEKLGSQNPYSDKIVIV